MSASIQVGDRVRWRPEMSRASKWVGTVTGIEGRMAQCDNRGYISLGLLEKVGKTMADFNLLDPLDQRDKLREEVKAQRTEIEGLQAVVIAQCEAMSQMAPAPERGMEARMAELEENWKTLGDYVTDVLSEVMGTSNPVTLTTCPLPSVRALAEFVRDA